MVLIELLLIFVTAIFSVIVYYKWAFTYWERKKVPFKTPKIPLGNIESLLRRTTNIGYRYKDFYDYFKQQGAKYAGIYMLSMPIYLPINPEYVKSVLVKDFECFDDRGIYHNQKIDPLSANIFCIGNVNGRWKHLRSKLSPTFSSGKMRMMFQTLIECTKPMQDVIDGCCERNEPFDVKELMACFTTDVISSCAFGLDCNSCKNKDERFRAIGREFFDFTKAQAVKNAVSLAFPNFCRSLGVRLVREDVANYFLNTIKCTVDYREKNNYSRKDFMQLLIDMKNNKNGNTENNLTEDELAASAFAFYIGGFETSSTTLNFALHELCLNQDIQEKARNEVKEVLSRFNGELTYESLSEMKYVGQVIDESLRKYPVLPILTRKCSKEYNIPGTDTILEKGTTVFISALGLHHDPEYYPEPEKFDPERFSEENKNRMVPFTYLPFGEGPRICLGVRFGLMQTKVALATVLNRYRFNINKRTEVPLKFHLYNFTTTPASEIYLDVEKI